MKTFYAIALTLIMAFGVTKAQNNISTINITTVKIPAGTFIMGSSIGEYNHQENETEHQVTLNPFYMSKYEISNSEFAAFLNAKGIDGDAIDESGKYPNEVLIYPSANSYNTDRFDWGLNYIDSAWIPVSGYENYPAINVTWYGAAEFASYVGGRLPTEAEWEYACRANTTTPFNTGNCLDNTQANYN